MKKKARVTVVVEIDIVRGLNEIANTIKDVVEYETEGPLNTCEIISITSDEVDVDRFYESGDSYKKGEKGFKSEEDYAASLE